MPSETLIPLRVKSVSDNPFLAWAEGHRVFLPRYTLERSGLAQHLDMEGNLVVPPEKPQVTVNEVDSLRLHAAFTDKKPVSARLPFSYQKVPPWLRSLLASIIGRWKRVCLNRWKSFPGWPLDLSSDFLADLAGDQPSPFTSGPTPVLLTHDIDSAEGLKRLTNWFLDIEESFGARSTNFIVPCAWPIEHSLLAQVKERGHDIGIHGYDHANLTPFLDTQERRERIEAARNLVERYEIRGYRSPSLLRTRALLKELVQLYQYDSSIPTSGGPFPIPNNGCASARPFQVEGIAEIPLSLPRDGSLRFLGYSPGQIVEIWIQCAEQISRSHGVVVLLTHCEARFSGNPPMMDTYRRFLDYVNNTDRFAWSSPREVLAAAFNDGGCGG